MGKRRNVVVGPVDFEAAFENYESRNNENVNNAMRKAVRKGETGPGAKARKIGQIKWK